jgi:hypothetical protein
VYELSTESGGYRYTLSPDEIMARPGVRRRTSNVVARFAEPSLHHTGVRLAEIGTPSGTTRAYEPLGGHGLTVEASLVQRILGDVTERPEVTVPIIRLRPDGTERDIPTPVGEVGHRLAVDWQAVRDAGYVTEGAVGFGLPPDPTRAPLYRWINRSSGTRLLTLGELPGAGSGAGFAFEGTLGIAHRPGTRTPRLLDLWELELDGVVGYSIEPSRAEAGGGMLRRVVARVHSRWHEGLLPLHGFATGSRVPAAVTTCVAEGESWGSHRSDLGFVTPGAPRTFLREAGEGAVPTWFEEAPASCGQLGHRLLPYATPVVEGGDASTVRVVGFAGGRELATSAEAGDDQGSSPRSRVRRRFGGSGSVG